MASLLTGVLILGLPAGAASKPLSSTLRVSAGGGGQADGNSSSPSVSADGRFVAFSSYASNLVPGDSNQTSDVFVRDLHANTTIRVSTASDSTEANGGSFSPSISADGNVVAFRSDATDLVPGDTQGQSDIFIHVLSTGVTQRVSANSKGVAANDDSIEPAISADGKVIAFSSVATNLVHQPVNETGLCCDIFVRNLATGRTRLVDVMLDGTGSADSFSPTLSADGRFVAFGSWGCDLVDGVSCEDQSNIFVRDTTTNSTVLVTRSMDGGVAFGCAERPAISADGSMVAFTSDGGDLAPNDWNGEEDVFVRNLVTGTTTRVSVTSKGAQTNGGFGPVAMSGDGRFIAFGSDAWNIIPVDSNLVEDIFVHDMRKGKTTRVSVSTSGEQADMFSANVAIASDGSMVAFESDADNLVSGDTNITTDVFARVGL
jgi:Tol biopolymer transport system component